MTLPTIALSLESTYIVVGYPTYRLFACFGVKMSDYDDDFMADDEDYDLEYSEDSNSGMFISSFQQITFLLQI